MQSYTPDRVINGTFGEVTIGDDYMAEVTGLEAKVTLEKTEVNQTGALVEKAELIFFGLFLLALLKIGFHIKAIILSLNRCFSLFFKSVE